jgi:hypothetical protein
MRQQLGLTMKKAFLGISVVVACLGVSAYAECGLSEKFDLVYPEDDLTKVEAGQSILISKDSLFMNSLDNVDASNEICVDLGAIFIPMSIDGFAGVLTNYGEAELPPTQFDEMAVVKNHGEMLFPKEVEFQENTVLVNYDSGSLSIEKAVEFVSANNLVNLGNMDFNFAEAVSNKYDSLDLQPSSYTESIATR